VAGIISALIAAFVLAQSPVVEKIGDGLYRIGQLRVDMKKRELTAPATINDVPIIEFLANTKGGLKEYESALTVESDAITFNAALILLGLDPARGRPSKVQFDAATPEGDAVELHLTWGKTRVRAEQLLFDQRTKKALAPRSWVYTGSSFYDAGHGRRFMAEDDGVLIGLMHGPAALIENPRNDAIDGYGSIIINPRFDIPPGSTVSLIVTAIGK
jgi:hypothetical protein